MGAWWPSRSSKPVEPSISVWRVRFPSASADVTSSTSTGATSEGAGDGGSAAAVPRTDVVLADPRLAAAIDGWAATGSSSVVTAPAAGAGRRAGARTQLLTRCRAIAARAPGAACGRCSTRPASCCTPTSVAPRCRPRRGRRAASRRPGMSTSSSISPRVSAHPAGAVLLAALRGAVPAAEDVLVVNNGAAALVLATTALAAGREVVVSRGEMVEIGDGFRLPDLIESTGARLREVGTTNRHARRLRAAHRSRHRLRAEGAPEQLPGRRIHPRVPVGELATLGVPLIVDVGSGLLAPDPLLPDEPDVPPRCGPALTSSPAAATSCSAARRPGCCSARRGDRPDAPASAGPRAAGRQAHPRRAGGDAARTHRHRSGPRLHARSGSRYGALCRTRRRASAARSSRPTARSAVAARPVSRCRGWAVAVPRRARGAVAHRRPRRSSAGSSAAAACSTCAAFPRPMTTSLRDAVRAAC